MNILDTIKNWINKKVNYAQVLIGGTPTYSNFGDNIYKSDSVQQAVSCIVNEVKKLEPKHIREIENDIKTPLHSNLQAVLDNPNPTMTSSEFLEKVCWNYFLNYNSFIIPTFSEWVDKQGTIHRYFESLNPVRPNQVTFLQDSTGRYFVKFEFDNQLQYTFPYNEIIHLRRNFSINEFMGGNEEGQPDNGPLLQTLKLNNELLNGLARALKVSTGVRGIIKYNSMLETKTLKEERDKFTQQIENNESAILATDLRNEYQQLVNDTKLVDESTLKFIDTKILRGFGVSIPILTGDYTKEQYEAFYQKTIEPLVVQFSQAFTKILFTQKEKSFGNKIVFYPKELVFMSISQKLEMIKELGASGTLLENEKRTAVGLPPLKELEGVRMQSLNYVDIKNAAAYQVGKTKEIQKEEPKNENKSIEFQKRSIDMNKGFENRQYDFIMRADEEKSNDKEKWIEGRPIVYDSKTDISGQFEEVIDSGALDKTDLKDVRFLVNHNTHELPLARSRNNNERSTMQLKKDDKGLAIKVKLDMENPRAVELYSAISRGDVSGMSFMFAVDGEKWDKLDEDYPTRHITSISRVLEVSAVTFPAYEDTEINARSQTLESARQAHKKSMEIERSKKANNDLLELEKLKYNYFKNER